MAIAITTDTKDAQRISRDLSILTGSIAFDASYPTGGELATAISAKFKTLFRVICEPKNGYLIEYIKSSNLLKVYRTVDNVAGTRIEVADTTDLSTALAVVNFIAVGRL